MEILERLSEKFSKDFDAMNLSNIAWSCAALNYHPAGSILSSVCDNLIAMARVGTLDPHRHRNLNLNLHLHRPPPPPRKPTRDANDEAKAPSPSPSSSPSHAPPPSAQALSNCLWALATLRQSSLAAKLARVVAEVTPAMTDQFNPDLAGVGGAFVTQTVGSRGVHS